jgi:spermidine/putrescine transport system permease protein
VRKPLALYATAFYAFLHLPLATLVVFSFNAQSGILWKGFSFRWYRAVLLDPQLSDAAWNSLLIATVATLLATSIGTLCAYGLWKRDVPVLSGSLYLGLVTPDIVVGVALLTFYNWIFRFLDIRLGIHTVIAAHVMFSLGYVVFVVMARLRTLDPALEEAALDLGANEYQAFYKVVLPALAPGIVAAALLVFTLSFDDYVITSLVAGVDPETLPMVIYAIARRGANPALNAISAMIVTGLGTLILVSERLQRR